MHSLSLLMMRRCCVALLPASTSRLIVQQQQQHQQQPCRTTVIVARKHKLDQPYPELDGRPLNELDDYPDRVPIHSKLYETVDLMTLRPDSQQLLSVRLSRDVPGLGESGHTVSVHRSRYWHYLYPLGWASLATAGQPFASSTSASDKDWLNSRVFTGPLYQLQRTLEAMHLLVPINSSQAAAASDFSLSDRHLRVALRRYGIEVPRRAIRLPDRLPALPSLSSASASGGATSRPFKVGVQLNNRVTVSVKASLRLVTLGEAGTGLPPAQLPQVMVDDWLTEMHPTPTLPEGERVFEEYLLQQGPPNFERILGSNRTRVKKQR